PRVRTFTATEAPRSCRRVAAARPRPRHAPVTTATRPAKSAFSIGRIVSHCLSSAPIHIILSLLSEEEERQNPAREAVLGNNCAQSQESRLELGLCLSD